MNAKKEFLSLFNGREVKCAYLSNGKDEDWYTIDEDNPFKEYILKVDYSKEDYKQFLESIDFEYDNGYGSQELFGLVWFKDGTWAERYEYDGAESWIIESCPTIPEQLK